MLILGIDTSAVAASAALLKDGKIISETYINSGLTHSQTLMSLIDSCLRNAGLTLNDTDAVAVSAGPGSFTGIRIGVSAVKGLCFVDDKPCFAVSTLEGLAHCADCEDCYICPVMDARCKQVYTALFEKKDGRITRITEDSPMTLDELAEKLAETDKRIVLIGDGADISFEHLSEKIPEARKFSEVFKYQHASGVAIAAYRNYNDGTGSISAGELVPSYLRLSQAERELKKSGDVKK